MAELNVHMDLSFGTRTLRFLLTAGMLFAGAPELSSENVTLTTYYPAPSGVYTQMITTGDTFLARDGVASKVGIGTSAPGSKLSVSGNMAVGSAYAAAAAPSAGLIVSGNVGIGTAVPASKLSVSGGIQPGDDSSACTAAKAGTIRWNAGAVEVCNGAAWGPIASLTTAIRQNTVTAWRWPAPTVGCLANERVLGGGGSCTGGAGYNFLYFSGPASNGWRIACDTPNAQMVTGVVYAVCGKL